MDGSTVAAKAFQSSIFDLQPTPILVISDDSAIWSANQASQALFVHDSLLGTHLASLPIRGLGHDQENLHQVLSSFDANKDGHHKSDTSSRLRVEISRQSPLSLVTASLLVTSLSINDGAYRILSFENVEEINVKFPALQRLEPENQNPTSYIGASADTDKTFLQQRFSRLRKAIYHNDERSGLLLSADQTFCYPKYQASENARPVEIFDMETFGNNWELWDPHFQVRQPYTELPGVWVNRHRQRYYKRYGLRKDGKNFVYHGDGQPLYDHHTGEYLGCVVWIKELGQYEDVAAADLKATLGDFKNICNRLPHFIWTASAEGVVDYFSEDWYVFTGLTEEQTMGWGYRSAINPDDANAFRRALEKAMNSKSEVTREARYKRHDGKWFWFSLRAKPLLDGDGKILKWYGTSTEVDNLVVGRQKAEARKAQVVQMLSLAHIGLFEVSATGQLNILEGHLAWYNAQDYPDVLNSSSNVPNDGMTVLAEHCHDIMSGRSSSVRFEAQIKSRWYKFRLMRDGQCKEKKQILGCSVDIQEQKERAKLEAENARLASEAAIEMEKSRLKSSFLAHMTHEIRTPIAGVIGITDMLAETNLDGDQRDCVSNILISAHNLLRIVNDILDLSKIEAGQMKFEMIPFDVYAVVLQVHKLFLQHARSNRLELTCRTGLSATLEAIGDPGRVRQILTNLVSNAIKFTPSGTVGISVELKGSDFKIVVSDTGIGVDAGTMASLFKPFVQGDASMARRYGGTGLGLSISRNLAHGMSGTLILESTPGEGTQAILTIPRGTELRGSSIKERSFSYEALSTPRPLPVRSRPSTPINGIRTPVNGLGSRAPSFQRAVDGQDRKSLILIVEDNAINQKVALNLVRKLGYDAHAVWNGQEALDFLELSTSSLSQEITLSSTKPAVNKTSVPSLILMDCQMPLLDGYEATRRLRNEVRYALVKSVPVIALTASAIHGDPEKCVAAGMDDYLSKPVTKMLLQAMIKKWISREKAEGTTA